jgi:hypothetical protein
VFNVTKGDAELDALPVAMQHVELGVPKGHAFAKIKKLRLSPLLTARFTSARSAS